MIVFQELNLVFEEESDLSILELSSGPSGYRLWDIQSSILIIGWNRDTMIFQPTSTSVKRWLTSKVSFGIIEFFVEWWWTILFEGTSKYKLSLMFNPLYFKILPDTNPSNVPNFQNVYKTCQYCYSIFIIEENRFFSWTRNETIDFVWTWCFGTDKNFWYDKSKI